MLIAKIPRAVANSSKRLKSFIFYRYGIAELEQINKPLWIINTYTHTRFDTLLGLTNN